MQKKIILTILYFLTLAGYMIAQTPGFNYQAVLRNPAGETMSNEAVTLHFSLLDTDKSVIYKESQALTTDELGILTCMIGTGNVESGTFSEITGKQDVTLRIEAELPGTTGMTSVGQSKLGIIPYALYGKDEDADPDNEMQELSIVTDSLIISGRGGIAVNQINYWQKTDSSFFLSLELLGSENQRDASNSISVQEIDNRVAIVNRGIDDEIRIATLSYDQYTRGSYKFSTAKFTNAESDIPEKTTRFFLPKTSNGVLVSNNGREEIKYVDGFTAGDVFSFGDWESRSSINKEGGRDSKSFEGHLLSDYFVDLILGGVGADFYKIGVDEFGYGFGVFCFDDDNASHREQAATFGGTMSTANDNGLTTLIGAVPGVDPTNGNLIVFNGTNLGTFSSINSEAAGTSSTYGANGQLNTTSGTFAGESNGGAHMTFAGNGDLGAYMWTREDGSSQMGADQFIMSTVAPGRSNEMANYAAPVGGESATYDRGTAKLVNGEATVLCPESFRWIADEQSMTVTITPLSAESKGIAVIEKTGGGFKVKELDGGTGTYQFDYLVMCKRKGQEAYEVVRPKPQLIVDHSRDLKTKIPAGPLKSIRDLYQK